MNIKFALESLASRESFCRIARMPLFSLGYKKYIRVCHMNKKFPSRVGIEVTDICNRDCVICPSGELKKTGDIDMALIRKIAQESSESDSKGIEFSLHKMGEPLLNKNIWGIIEILKGFNKNSVVSLATNGVLLKDNAQGVIDSKADIVKVSVSSAYLQPGKEAESEIR